MKILILMLFLCVIGCYSYGQQKVTIAGKVYNQNNQPLKHVNIRLLLDGGNDKETKTSSDGSFYFHRISKDDSYWISGKKNGYLKKTGIYYSDTKKSNDTVSLSFTLRERRLAIINTDSISSKDLGVTLRAAIEKFKIDTLECMIQEEPIGVARGIQAELGDSTMIFLQIPRRSNFANYFRNILDDKVTGIGLAFPNCTTKGFGKDFVWWGIRNHYCDK